MVDTDRGPAGIVGGDPGAHTQFVAAGLGASNSAPIVNHDDPCTHYAWRPPPRNAVGLGLLRKVFAFVAARVRGGRDPMGAGYIKRQASPFGPLHRLRP